MNAQQVEEALFKEENKETLEEINEIMRTMFGQMVKKGKDFDEGIYVEMCNKVSDILINKIGADADKLSEPNSYYHVTYMNAIFDTPRMQKLMEEMEELLEHVDGECL